MAQRPAWGGLTFGAATTSIDQARPAPFPRRRFFALKHGNSIFFETGTSGLPLVWSKDPELFDRWAAGRTGMPLVDANMRELAATGGDAAAPCRAVFSSSSAGVFFGQGRLGVGGCRR